MLRNTPHFKLDTYYWDNCQRHWAELVTMLGASIQYAGLEQLSHLPDRGLPYHLFSFSHSFFYLFGYGSDDEPIHARDILISCLESLALALECDPAPGTGWLQTPLRVFGFFPAKCDPQWDTAHCSVIQPEHATTLRRNVKRIKTAIRAKVLCASFAFRHSL
jgi:hypothetical protein